MSVLIGTPKVDEADTVQSDILTFDPCITSHMVPGTISQHHRISISNCKSMALAKNMIGWIYILIGS